MRKLYKKKIIIQTSNSEVYLERLQNLNTGSKDYIKWLNDKKINKLLQIRYQSHNKKSLNNWIVKLFDSNDNLLFGIFLKKEKLHIGNIKAKINFQHLRAEIGILIGLRTLHGKGYGSQSINLLCNFLFDKLKLKKIYAGSLDSNIASQKVFKKSKFKIEAKLINYRILNKKFVNEIIMSRTNV